jgi:hypothetical protein
MSILVRLRSLVIPASIGLILVAAIGWYNLLWLPSQQRYLDDRNLRVLKTLSEQLRLSIAAFDKMMDNAADSGIQSESLQAYLKNVAPQLEKADENESKQIVGEDYGDPPKVAVAMDEGTSFLYMAFQRASSRYAIRTDLSKLIDKLSPPAIRCPFDAIVITQSDGAVIYQKSQAGLVLTRMNMLEGASGDAKPGKPSVQIPLDALLQSSRQEQIAIGGATYRFYSQPLQLPFGVANPSGKGRQEAHNETISKPWIVCGLVRMERFRSESQAISYEYVVWLSAFILLAIASYPFLKLHVSSAAERFRASDVLTLAISTAFAATVLTFVLLDLSYWRKQCAESAEGQMIKLAAAIDTNFGNERKKAYDQLRAFYTNPELRANLRKVRPDPGQARPNPLPALASSGKECRPAWACRTEIRSDSKTPFLDYPYLVFVTWSDALGKQRIKWTTRKSVTPFLSLDDPSIPYYAEIKRAFRNAGDPNPVPTEGIGSQYSANTGDNITVFWKLLDSSGNPVPESAGAKEAYNWFCASLVTKPTSVFDAVMPGGFQFAVINVDGTVIFHSDPTRNLRENLFAETDRAQEVRSRVAARAEGSLVTSYMGRPTRLHLRPMTANPNQQWTVVIFCDLHPEETANLEAVSIASILFLFYAAVMAMLIMLLSWACRAKTTRCWFWPDSRKAGVYWILFVVNAVACAAMAFLCQISSSLTTLVGGILTVLSALAINVAMLKGGRQNGASSTDSGEGSSPRWKDAYFAECSTLVVVVAILPCLPCFKVASDFQQRLLIKSGQLRLAADLERRAGSTRTRYQPGGVAGYSRILLAGPETVTTPYFSYHRAIGITIHSAQDYDLSNDPDPCGLGTANPCVDRLLSGFTPSYNEVAAENLFLAQSGSSDKWRWFSGLSMEEQDLVLSKKEPPNRVLTISSPWTPFRMPWKDSEWWAGIAVLLAVVFLLVRSAMKRMFLLDLVDETPGESLPAECDNKTLQHIFSRRPKSQKLALVQVAQERLVNPGNRDILCKLMKEGLIAREWGLLKIKNACFANFLKNAVPPKVIKHWERDGTDVRLASLRTSLLVAGLGVGGFVIYSQSDVLNTWVTYMTGIAALIPACLRVVDIVRNGGAPER